MNRIKVPDYQNMSIREIYANPHFYEFFVKRYINNLPRMCIELFRITPTTQQYKVLVAVNFCQGRIVVPSGHGTGKTKSIGLLSACFFLLFPFPIIRIIAPSLKQVTNFSFKEIRACFDSLEEEYRDANGKIVQNPWAFLVPHIKFNVEKILEKDNPTSWYIEAKTAPKGKSENLSGQHKKFYLLVFDEMSGIDDEHITASLGGLSEDFNSAIGFSQHTKLHGLFHEFVTINERWQMIRLSSEDSEIVSKVALKQWRDTYTENEYRVRVEGLEPLFTDGNLITPQEASSVFVKKEWVDNFTPLFLIISIDVAYRGLRNNSVITTIEVDGNMRMIVKRIEVTNEKPVACAKEAFKQAITHSKTKKYKQIIIGIDATAGGAEASEELGLLVDDSGIEMISSIPITWGSARLIGLDKELFINQRAKAYSRLQVNILEGKLYIYDDSYKVRTKRELSSIPFKYKGDDFKMQIEPKENWVIESPDIGDTLAQGVLMLEEINV